MSLRSRPRRGCQSRARKQHQPPPSSGHIAHATRALIAAHEKIDDWSGAPRSFAAVEEALRAASAASEDIHQIHFVRYTSLALILGGWLPRVIAAAPTMPDSERWQIYGTAAVLVRACLAHLYEPAAVGRSEHLEPERYELLAEGLDMVVGAPLA